MKLSRGARRSISLLFLIFIIAFTQRNSILKFAYPIEYEDTVLEYAEYHDIEPSLVLGIIRVESNFKSDAVSNKGAIGLMQIMPKTGVWIAETIGLEKFEERDLYDYDTNIKMGTWYIKNLIDEFDGDVVNALAAYNGGVGNVKSWLSDQRYSDDGTNLSQIPFKETEEYVKKVIKAQGVYRELYGEEH